MPLLTLVLSLLHTNCAEIQNVLQSEHLGMGGWKPSCSPSSALSNSLCGLLVAYEAQKSLLFQDQTFLV